VRDVISDAATAGHARTDVPPEELARYSLHALSAAGSSPSNSAVGRLIELTLSGLRPPPPPAHVTGGGDGTAPRLAADGRHRILWTVVRVLCEEPSGARGVFRSQDRGALSVRSPGQPRWRLDERARDASVCRCPAGFES
jgi:hypothetical protein